MLSIFGKPAEGANRLSVTATVADTIAAPGNQMPTYIVVSVTDVNGAPVAGLSAANFTVTTMVVAPGGAAAKIQQVAGGDPGLYTVSVTPVGGETWKNGVYIFGVTVQNNSQKGQALASVNVE